MNSNTRLSSLNHAINNFGLIRWRAHHDLSAGSLQTTGNDTDLAIDGEGFFSVQTKAGVRYTRDGSFRLNAQRQLVDSQGDGLLGEQGPITLPDGKLNISDDGTVSVDGAIVDKLQVVDFPPGTPIDRSGGQRQISRRLPARAVPAASTQVKPGNAGVLKQRSGFERRGPHQSAAQRGDGTEGANDF